MLSKSYHIEMDIKLKLYGDRIISLFGQITATRLSKALGGSISHDTITRFLSYKEYVKALQQAMSELSLLKSA